MLMHGKPMVRHGTQPNVTVKAEVICRLDDQEVLIDFLQRGNRNQLLVMTPAESRELEKQLHIANAGLRS